MYQHIRQMPNMLCTEEEFVIFLKPEGFLDFTLKSLQKLQVTFDE